MADDFCLIHGYDHMKCERVPGAIPYCDECEREQEHLDQPQQLFPGLRALLCEMVREGSVSPSSATRIQEYVETEIAAGRLVGGEKANA